MHVLGHSPKGGSASRIRCLESERLALLKFKDELVDAHSRLSSWGDEEHKQDCFDDDGIGDALLKGMISASLLELQHLQYLDLSYNDFGNGPIPEFIGSLSKLRHPDLYYANFSGRIPHHLGNLTKLLYLDLGFNENCYSENLDWVSCLHSLVYLDLTYTNFSKATTWLQAISKLNSIKELRFYSCKLPDILSSSLPSNINSSAPLAVLDLAFNHFTFSTLTIIRWFSNFNSIGLTSISLSYNNMSGPTPYVFANMTSLAKLRLRDSSLEGGIPRYFGNVSNLLHIDLSWNNLTGELSELLTNLSGPLEQKLQSLWLFENMIMDHFQICRGPVPDLSFSSSLEEVDLGNNKFNGTLTESIRRLSQLKYLDLSLNSFLTVKFNPHWVPLFQLEYLSLSHCRLGPQFPSWLKTQKKLFYIDISNSGISDNFPSWFGEVDSKLEYLNASNNQMYGVLPKFFFSTIFGEDEREWKNGMIPHSFGSLSALSLLYLRNNSLSGELPTSMGNCTKLRMIDFGENRLTGKIPTWIGDRFSELKVLVLRFNKFYGSIPPNLCGLENILSSNEISGVIPNYIHKCIAMTREESNSNPPFITEGDYIRFSHFPGLDRFLSFENTHFMWKGNEVKFVNHLGPVKLIDLLSNNLVGKIPSEITKLVDIGQTCSLEFLDFSRNQLSNSIPANLGELSFLGVLNLSYNNLFGKIPVTTQLQMFDESSYMGDESHQGSGNNAMSNGENDGDEFTTEGFYIAFGLGLIVGFGEFSE
ncbi:Non-specific serine/threonine protein kinase [Handroanthus impetiginosus]|uniref:Non-specific serine/threonine protein kinase n=1 Tax=Handroanthus impetiginosus TaxID=429701 RepID=A0A2G9GGF3_9LAMI|nr:Non-specific serine/threonine protein kinase [Handroanthus impetiginosus]